MGDEEGAATLLFKSCCLSGACSLSTYFFLCAAPCLSKALRCDGQWTPFSPGETRHQWALHTQPTLPWAARMPLAPVGDFLPSSVEKGKAATHQKLKFLWWRGAQPPRVVWMQDLLMAGRGRCFFSSCSALGKTAKPAFSRDTPALPRACSREHDLV